MTRINAKPLEETGQFGVVAELGSRCQWHQATLSEADVGSMTATDTREVVASRRPCYGVDN